MIDYGENPSNQSEMDIESPGAKVMNDAREWVESNPDAWERYMDMARVQSNSGPVSPNLLVQLVRATARVSIRNGLSPALARIALEQEPTLRFRLARSMTDGFCEAKL